MHGSAALAQALHAQGLIDEYRLFIEPIVLGTGKRLFEPGAAATALQLVESKPMSKETFACRLPADGQAHLRRVPDGRGLRPPRHLTGVASRRVDDQLGAGGGPSSSTPYRAATAANLVISSRGLASGVANVATSRAKHASKPPGMVRLRCRPCSEWI